MAEDSKILTLVAGTKAPKTGYEKPPKHFKKGPQTAAWRDLIERSSASVRTVQNYFAFEIAATLLAKFRAGERMSVSEAKELKSQLVALGLAKAEGDSKPAKSRKPNAHYFE